MLIKAKSTFPLLSYGIETMAITPFGIGSAFYPTPLVSAILLLIGAIGLLLSITPVAIALTTTPLVSCSLATMVFTASAMPILGLGASVDLTTSLVVLT